VEKGGFGLDAAGLSTAGILIALLVVGVGLWEQARPDHPEREPAGPRWIANIVLFAIGDGAWLVVAPLLSYGATWLGVVEAQGGIGLHFLLMLPLLDAGDYALHRLSHRVGWLWRLHAIHHTDTEIDVTTTLRHHPAEVLVVGFAFAGIGMLIGAAPEEMVAYGVLAFAVQLVAHANVALPPALERVLSLVVVTPPFHRFHHSRDQRQSDANYGQVLVIWDRLLGTLAPRDGRDAPSAFGVEAFLAPRFRTIAGMLLQPLAATIPPAR